jgi:hypothetical protein
MQHSFSNIDNLGISSVALVCFEVYFIVPNGKILKTEIKTINESITINIIIFFFFIFTPSLVKQIQ